MVLWIVLSGALAVGALASLTFAIGRLRFDRMVSAEVVELYEGVQPAEASIDVEREIRNIPDPAARYLRFALGATAPEVTACRLRHGGTFRLEPDKPWLPIDGEQYYTLKKPAFIWHATANMAPLMWFEARDKYLNGVGALLAKVNSTITVARVSGSDVGVSALYRWLAEAPWFPHAFVVTPNLVWEEVDGASVAAVLTDGDASARVVFHMAADGRIESMTADDRTRDVNGAQVRTKWSARYRDWRDVEGVKVPFDCQVFWHLDDGEFCYARFALNELEFNNPKRFE
jgi:hypothetical protein